MQRGMRSRRFHLVNGRSVQVASLKAIIACVPLTAVGKGSAVSLFTTETSRSKKKSLGSFYTPPEVARSLVRWVIRSDDDRLLDPSCGDGRFLAEHRNVVGVDRDIAAVVAVAEEVPHATVHAAEFFDWASSTGDVFDCVAGNPPFIRYQQFNGETRKTALRLCSEAGASLNGLTSSWAPFVVVAASKLSPGGRLAFATSTPHQLCENAHRDLSGLRTRRRLRWTAATFAALATACSP